MGDSVNLQFRIFVFLLAIVLSAAAPSQTEDKTLSGTSPELKIRIIPNKGTYALREEVFTKAEFTNLTDRTLCFPEPDQDCEDSASGDLVTIGEVAETGERDRFHCRLVGGSIPRDKLLTKIEYRWIKLAPNAKYFTKHAVANGYFDSVGQWRLNATYRPPEPEFGNAKEYRAFVQSTAQQLGCAVPRNFVSAKPVIITVVPPSEPK